MLHRPAMTSSSGSRLKYVLAPARLTTWSVQSLCEGHGCGGHGDQGPCATQFWACRCPRQPWGCRVGFEADAGYVRGLAV